MDLLTAKRKRRRLIMILAAAGFLIAVAIGAYSQLTDSSPPKPLNVPLWTTFMILCPSALLSVPLIDVEPGSTDFVIMWLAIGLLNSGLYAVVGMIVGRLRWKLGQQTSA